MPIHIEQVPIDSPHGRGLIAIRMQVFVEEQNVPADIEMDAYDSIAIHLAALDGDAVIGTCRLIKKGTALKVGRVAVLKNHRGQGIGRLLMEAALARARTEHFASCELTAQVPVIGFYEKFGFTPHGNIFDEAGIPHRAMTLRLA
jgi:predicted GNAT family N-acyltransferase